MAALSVPIRYINNGEPLNEITLNRGLLDSQVNLEKLFVDVNAYDPGTVEAEANRVVLRDSQGRSKFGVPEHDQHAWRVADHLVFREFLLDSQDYIKLDRLRKASTSQQGIVKLVDSYTSTSKIMAPTADALRRAYNILLDRIKDLENQLANLPRANTNGKYGVTTLADTVFYNPLDNRNNMATTPAAVAKVYDDVVNYWHDWFNDNFSTEFFGAGQMGKIIGWTHQRLPSGLILSMGAASTGPGGYTDITLPFTYPNGRLSVIAAEQHSNGWFLEGSPTDGSHVHPTIYGFNVNESKPTTGGGPIHTIRIYGARIFSDGIPRLGKGLAFNWMIIGH